LRSEDREKKEEEGETLRAQDRANSKLMELEKAKEKLEAIFRAQPADVAKTFCRDILSRYDPE
jgi:hypothetical protein